MSLHSINQLKGAGTFCLGPLIKKGNFCLRTWHEKPIVWNYLQLNSPYSLFCATKMFWSFRSSQVWLHTTNLRYALVLISIRQSGGLARCQLYECFCCSFYFWSQTASSSQIGLSVAISVDIVHLWQRVWLGSIPVKYLGHLSCVDFLLCRIVGFSLQM